MLTDVAECGSGNPLQRQLRLLEAQHEIRHGAGVGHVLGELPVVSRDVAQRPGRGLLHRGVELPEAADQRPHGARLHHGLRQLRRVLGHGAEDEGRRLLVEAVGLRERDHQLLRDPVGDHGVGQLVAVVGQAAQRQGGGLLDGRDVVQQQGPQQRHHARILQRVDVLRARGQVRHRLDEGDPRLLVLLEDLQHGPAHLCPALPKGAAAGPASSSGAGAIKPQNARGARGCKRPAAMALA
mmetsp:Transcript_98692/g.287868  ORF Transcript_98692/g.287868 Transcript_98692/m.287868 type:complete len:239 (-) Transcript_98692:21-737(-)